MLSGIRISLLAALNDDRVIGKNGDQPWKISDDLKRFKQLTTGKTIVMGRKTYDAIGRPLPNRRNIVLTSRVIQGVETYPSIESLRGALNGADELFVIGGGEIYSIFLPFADTLYLTIVDQHVDAPDVLFPQYEHLIGPVFRMTYEERHDGFTFRNYQRIQ